MSYGYSCKTAGLTFHCTSVLSLPVFLYFFLAHIPPSHPISEYFVFVQYLKLVRNSCTNRFTGQKTRNSQQVKHACTNTFNLCRK